MSQTAAETVLPSRDDAREQWARWVFQIAPEVPAEAIREEMLRALAHRGFLAPTVWRDAMALVQPPPDDQAAERPLPFEFHTAYERWLRRAMESFAGDFFDVPVARRSAVWNEFAQASAAYPRLLARLDYLRVGLDVDPSALRESDPHVRRLAGWITGLFASRPLTAAAMRRQFVRATEADVSAWQRAARRLRRRHPQIAALTPGLVEELAEAKRRRARLRATARPAGSTMGQTPSPVMERWPILVLVMVVLGLARAFTSIDHSKPRPSPNAAPSIPKFDVTNLPLLPGNTAPPGDAAPQGNSEASEALSRLFDGADGNNDGILHSGSKRFRLEMRDGRTLLVPVDPETPPTSPPSPVAPPAVNESTAPSPGMPKIDGIWDVPTDSPSGNGIVAPPATPSGWEDLVVPPAASRRSRPHDLDLWEPAAIPRVPAPSHALPTLP